MRIPFISRKDFFTPHEKNQIVEAIKEAEKQTSGEIRVFVESRCRFVNPLDRAEEIFWILRMNKTAQRNAVLVYVAIKDKQLALYGDQGIHEKVGESYWSEKVREMISHIGQRVSHAEAIIRIIHNIGGALHQHFPYNRDTDKNELPDDIVFGS